MKKQKESILVLADWFAPAYKAGGPVRSCENFAYAMSDVYNVFILTSNTDLGGDKLDVEINEWLEYDENIKVQYITKEKETYKNLSFIIKEINPKYIYLNSLFSLFYSLTILYALFLNSLKSKVILAPRGGLHEGAIKFKYLKKKLFLNLLKWSGIAEKLKFQATDEQEKEDIIKHLSVDEQNIEVVPNLPQSKQKTCTSLLKKQNLKLVFISRVAPKKNILFFLNCLKKLETKPNIELSIYGPIEEGYWSKCQEVVGKLPSHIKVNYKGSINHKEVGKVLEAHHFFVLSTFGENFGHAIFEAFAIGRPVLISDQTPWKELEKQKVGWDIPLSNEEKWTKSIEDAAGMKQEEYDAWCQSSWNYAHHFIYHSGLKEKYLKLFS